MFRSPHSDTRMRNPKLVSGHDEHFLPRGPLDVIRPQFALVLRGTFFFHMHCRISFLPSQDSTTPHLISLRASVHWISPAPAFDGSSFRCICIADASVHHDDQ
ncbi:hypothetical protein HGRIS_003091 [Hohenbuehelia grisea]|uniref:Uncharacterized protein n=1 Tax=Hohenbuehelia grisea TaxID=104357 RepID=A0ABR3JN68_9AGAR